MYFLKIKFIFRNEAFPVFHYQQFRNPPPQPLWTVPPLLIPAEAPDGRHSILRAKRTPQATLCITYSICDTRTSEGLVAPQEAWGGELTSLLKPLPGAVVPVWHTDPLQPILFAVSSMPTANSNYLVFVFRMYS